MDAFGRMLLDQGLEIIEIVDGTGWEISEIVLDEASYYVVVLG